MQHPQKHQTIQIANHKDIISRKWRITYRIFEIIPGLSSWLILISALLLSFFKPIWVAIFIIVFDVQWLLKVIYLSFNLILSYKHFKRHLKINWLKKCKEFQGKINFQNLYHLIILPTYQESYKVIDSTFKGLKYSDYPRKKMIVILALEEKDQENGLQIAKKIEKKYGSVFYKFIKSLHPFDLPGELRGKGSNETWAAKVAKKFIDQEKIAYENIIVSSFDIDTVVHKKYFSCMSYHYMINPEREKRSYQPIPFYYNNIWDSPSLMRVIATQTSFWMMVEQERTQKLVTFSSHSMSFKTALKVGYWQTNIVSEDSRIFYQCLFYFQGDYKVQSLYMPVYMDTVLDDKYHKSMLAQYKQQRRWGWGVENCPYVLYRMLKTKIQFWQKIKYAFQELEGKISWATTSLILLFLGWLPVVLGGEQFKKTVLAASLPRITQILMTLSMIGLIGPVILNTILLPKRPKHHKKRKWAWMILQWILFPIGAIFFGSMPALDAQTRLMLGKYMGFAVTPKARK